MPGSPQKQRAQATQSVYQCSRDTPVKSNVMLGGVPREHNYGYLLTNSFAMLIARPPIATRNTHNILVPIRMPRDREAADFHDSPPRFLF